MKTIEEQKNEWNKIPLGEYSQDDNGLMVLNGDSYDDIETTEEQDIYLAKTFADAANTIQCDDLHRLPSELLEETKYLKLEVSNYKDKKDQMLKQIEEMREALISVKKHHHRPFSNDWAITLRKLDTALKY